MPAGLTLNASTGVISGTPTTPVTNSNLGFKVTDSTSPVQTATATLAITVAPNVLSITTTALPNGTVGTPYSQALAATGGTGADSWQLTSGTLPGGLTLNASTGVISGTPTAQLSANSALTFKVTDSGSPQQTATASLTLTMVPVTLTISTSSLANGVVGTAYSQTLAANGGTGADSWQITAGTLPAGLTLNASTGQISGTPTAGGSPTLTFQVSDAGSPVQNATKNLTLIIQSQLSITTTSLTNGAVGSPYAKTLTATGGAGSYTWQLTSGTLPAGLTLIASTGLVSGTPTASASAISLSFSVTDGGPPSQTAAATFTLTIAPQLLVTTTALANGAVDTPYSQQLTTSGGSGAVSWQLTSGTLPTGLTLHASTGVIDGTPTAAANLTPLTFKATDSGSPVQTASASLTLSIAGQLTVTTSALLNGAVGTAYSQPLAAAGGNSIYSWQLTSGTLPAGLTMNASGVISGTPSATATNLPLTFKVTDTGSPVQTASATLNLTIAAQLLVTTASLPNGAVNTAYSQQLAATGGTGGISWQLTSGTLPAGLTLHPSSGVIDGTPTAAGASPVTFKATDSGSPAQNATASLTMTIAGQLTVTTSALLNGAVGTPYSQTLAATGGNSIYSWQLTSGTLPAGLTMNAAGVISGTPSATATNLPLTFKVTDTGSPVQTASATLNLTIAAQLLVTTGSLQNGVVNTAYSQTLASNGGTGAITWQLASGTLPAGLTLHPSTGVIDGTPTAAGASPVTFKATDSGSPAQNATGSLTMTIVARLADHHRIAPQWRAKYGIFPDSGSHRRQRYL
jgi:hypothetical protein